MTTPLVLVSNRVKDLEQYQLDYQLDIAPQLDYIEIALRLGGEIAGHGIYTGAWYRWALSIEKILKLDLIESLHIVSRLSEFNVYLSTSEKTALPLAMFLAFCRNKNPHVVIGHHLSSINKRRLFRFWRLYKSFHHVVCVCKAQADYAMEKLGLPRDRVDFIYDNVDHRFYRPLDIPEEKFILAIGQEQRDYPTLIQAISGTDIPLVIVASSPWSNFPIEVQAAENVKVLRNISYINLRELYAQAKLVVVPLFDVNYAAGANSVLEAMSMGKALILSQTRGIQDYVAHGESGCFVPPGSSQILRASILNLWEDERLRHRLGMNARQAVTENMTLDLYVDRLEDIVCRSVNGA